MFGFFRNLFYGPERGEDYRFPWERDEDLDRGREERLARRRRRFEEEDAFYERRGREDIVTNGLFVFCMLFISTVHVKTSFYFTYYLNGCKYKV